MKISIVGGGTAGLVAALVLKHTYPKFSIDIIRSKKIGTIGVGEGTTEHWQEFMQYIGISHQDLVVHCDATYKSGIMFQNWSKEDYLHSVDFYFTEKYNDINFLYAYQAANNRPPKELVSRPTWDSKVSLIPDLKENITSSPSAQYHFNTEKLNTYLSALCREKDISIIDDEIQDVLLKDTGEISQLLGENSTYNYDFYIDCTGFRRMLIKKLGAKWQSYSKFLKMNSAIVFPTENKDYEMWTTARAMNAGWMFRIPVWDRTGNGYIYDSNYITEDDAKNEVEQYLGREVEIKKKIQFDPGTLDKFWIKNCCAIGLSANFVEPLEASSIGTSIQQSFLLASKIFNYSETSIEQYNKEIDDIMNNILDFIALHYITPRDDTEFWRDLKNVELPPGLQKKLNLWKNRMPVDAECQTTSGRALFLSHNFFIVMYSLGIVNKSAIQSQIKHIPDNILQYAKHKIYELDDLVNQADLVSHKTALSLIRDICE